MAVTDPIGDLLTRIRNGQLRGLAKISSPNYPTNMPSSTAATAMENKNTPLGIATLKPCSLCIQSLYSRV